MAGDWIKMRCDLANDPSVVGIAKRLSAKCPQSVREMSSAFAPHMRNMVIGMLHQAWSWADSHTTDGIAPHVDYEFVDFLVGMDGFAEAMSEVGWLSTDDAKNLVFVDYEKHNGATAKRRAVDARRKKGVRDTSAKCPHENGQNADQRREEKISISTIPKDQVDEIWEAYPRKVGKMGCDTPIRRAILEVGFSSLLESVRRYAESRRGQEKKFTKHPKTWFTNGCWDDDAVLDVQEVRLQSTEEFLSGD